MWFQKARTSLHASRIDPSSCIKESPPTPPPTLLKKIVSFTHTLLDPLFRNDGRDYNSLRPGFDLLPPQDPLVPNTLSRTTVFRLVPSIVGIVQRVHLRRVDVDAAWFVE